MFEGISMEKFIGALVLSLVVYALTKPFKRAIDKAFDT